ncbi:hypothetical protein GCM10010365_25250 [Streptomyces poonensis]|uniref:Uncharacterized protein n=1 Tax=Streptomyces poonensis TaxID=68255 RepID=A0A918PGM7_9ACTN|nr:hypothetical protein GCM10010365_25250 [Streptomyces poonensis]GLJ89471.1 hypothetical protein GCM10017589_20710 [Streptomyces poonensis]
MPVSSVSWERAWRSTSIGLSRASAALRVSSDVLLPLRDSGELRVFGEFDAFDVFDMATSNTGCSQVG